MVIERKSEIPSGHWLAIASCKSRPRPEQVWLRKKERKRERKSINRFSRKQRFKNKMINLEFVVRKNDRMLII